MNSYSDEYYNYAFANLNREHYRLMRFLLITNPKSLREYYVYCNDVSSLQGHATNEQYKEFHTRLTIKSTFVGTIRLLKKFLHVF